MFQDVKTDESLIETCFKCHNFLKDVYRFRRKCLAVEEIFKNDLQDVKHEVELILKNVEDDILSDTFIKKETTIENDELEIKVNKIEADSGSEQSDNLYEPYMEVPFVSINEINEGHSQNTPHPIEDALFIEFKENKDSKPVKKRLRSTKGVKRKPYKRKHSTDRPYACEICPFVCARPSQLKIHVRKHTGERPFSCDLCDYVCSAKHNLILHWRNKHCDERPHACDLCDYRSKTKSAMRIHKRQHAEVKDFMCELCPYSNATLANLKSHIRSAHTGEKPYICDRCPYRSVSAGALRIHIKLHDDHKKFPCKECSFVSSSLKNLRAHMTKHTGDKPFKCDLCGTTFTVHSSHKRHLRKKHGINPNKKKS